MKYSAEEYKRAFTTPFAWAMTGYYVVMVVVGLSIPDDILSAHVWAREFCDRIAAIVPQIDRITALKLKPDVNRFYFSLLWATSPVCLAFCFGLVLEGRKQNYPMWTMALHKAVVRWPVIAFAVAWSQCLWWVDPALRLSKGLFVNPFGRALVSQISLFIVPVAFSAGLAIWILGWLTGYIPRNIRKQQHGE